MTYSDGPREEEEELLGARKIGMKASCSWRSRALIRQRVSSLILGTPCSNLVNQMHTEESQVSIPACGHHNIRENLRGVLVTLIMKVLLECSHLLRGLVLRDRISRHNLRLL